MEKFIDIAKKNGMNIELTDKGCGGIVITDEEPSDLIKENPPMNHNIDER